MTIIVVLNGCKLREPINDYPHCLVHWSPPGKEIRDGEDKCEQIVHLAPDPKIGLATANRGVADKALQLSRSATKLDM